MTKTTKNTLNNAVGQSVSLWNKIVTVCRYETVRFCLGLALVLFAAFLLLAFTSYFATGAADQSILDSGSGRDLLAADNGVRNYTGARGAQLSSYLISDCFGVSAVFIAVFLMAAGIRLMKVRRLRLWRWFFACALLLVWFSVFFGFVSMYFRETFLYLGGLHGYNVSCWLVSQVGVPGLVLLLLGTGISLLVGFSRSTMERLRSWLRLGFLKRRAQPQAEAGPAPAAPEEPGKAAVVQAADAAPKPDGAVAGEAADDEPEAGEEDLEAEVEETPGEPVPADRRHGKADPAAEVEMTVETPAPDPVVVPAGPARPAEAQAPQFTVEARADEKPAERLSEPYNPRLDLENYHFPTLDLMKHYDNAEPVVDMEEQTQNKNRIVETLESFGIKITSIKATVGPTVTLYEITPQQGVRISRIKGLEDDIALSLSALGIRIIAPIPGKGTIGIEVPNSSPKIVSGQSILGSKKFQDSAYDLPVALGKTITNEVFMFDLCKMPHILVAGATGQGKSVGLNAIIASLLYKKHPSELKFVMVDPKKVEFSIYSVIERHFLAKLPDEAEPIITDVTKVVQTLKSLCVEMDTRYDLLKMAHVRNVKEYNDKFVHRQLNPEKGHRYMPYIVVIIDEFGDLIMTAGKEIELPIARIAQLARAVGIHMVIATQRPTTNIITGTIKANFPARIAFRVSSRVDSQTILDRPGADRLIGRGDMLFLQGADPVRVQCAFIDTPEVVRISEFIARQQGYPTAFYLPEAPDENGAGAGLGEGDSMELDPLFDEAARLIVVHQQGSTSLIQRKFSIGYNRAGRLMDQLERAGIVGPTQGAKPREVFCTDETDLQMRLDNLRQKMNG